MKSTVKRSISGLVFVAVTIAAFTLCPYGFAAYMLFALCIMMKEFFDMTIGSGEKVLTKVLAIATAMIGFCLVFAHASFGAPLYLAGALVFPLALTMASTLKTMDSKDFSLTAPLLCALVWVGLPVILSPLAVFDDAGEFSGTLILCLIGIIWASDTGAYIFGMWLGQKYGKKMCPNISPKKSWIGFWGGMFCAVLCAAILGHFGLIGKSFLEVAGLGVLMHVTGVAGDLFESMWKRHYGIKDSGNIIPGHGGLLDRFDSSLFALPCGAVYLYLTGLLQ